MVQNAGIAGVFAYHTWVSFFVSVCVFSQIIMFTEEKYDLESDVLF